MNTPHTPSRTRSPSAWRGKCERGDLSQPRICQHTCWSARGAGLGGRPGGEGSRDHAARVRCPGEAGLHPGAPRSPPPRRERVSSTPPRRASRPAAPSRGRNLLSRRWSLASGVGRRGIDRAGIEKVGEVIRPYVRVTPVVEVRGGDFGLGDFSITLKLEMFQHSGSFKARGAFTNLLTREIPAAGVVAASGGDDGVAAWYAGKIKVIGVEPESAPTLTEALKAGRPVDAPAGGIAADSLAPRKVGELMFPIARAHVATVLLVSDAAIRRAQDALWSAVRIVAEPGGAAAFAALLGGAYAPAAGGRVGVMVGSGTSSAVGFATG